MLILFIRKMKRKAKKLNAKEVLDFRIHLCNSSSDFSTSCLSCEKYSVIFNFCRQTAEFEPKKCALYLHIIGLKRRATALDIDEVNELLREETKELEEKQLKLF